MMKKLFRLFVFAGLTLGLVMTASPQVGVDYKVLKTPQLTNVPASKIEVIEFFWYGCPHCRQMEPLVAAWAGKLLPDVVYRHVPVAFNDNLIPHTKMYYALDALGLSQSMMSRVFNEIQVNKNYLLTLRAQANFFAKHGIDKWRYLNAYQSFFTMSAIKRDKKLIDNYQIDSVPTFVVQGKYETSPALTNSLDGTLRVLDVLIAQIRAKKL